MVLDGEYGQQDLSMSVPAVLGKGGVKDIIEYELASDEQEGLKKTVETLKNAKKVVDDSFS